MDSDQIESITRFIELIEPVFFQPVNVYRCAKVFSSSKMELAIAHRVLSDLGNTAVKLRLSKPRAEAQ
jgi:hypothetical protein